MDEILVSASVNAKINQRHHLTRQDVEEVVARSEQARLSPNEDGVIRLLLVGVTASGRRVKVVLYPTERSGVWRLATAFMVR